MKKEITHEDAREIIKQTINKLLNKMALEYNFCDDDTLGIIRNEFNLN